jgi:precorrin-2/cobalt-factor-2 C20-methyltransferase
MPMVVERFPAQAVYDSAQAVLRAHLCAGQDVAVLCQGDPFFYGSFMYLFARLAHEHPIQIVPGVSALTACAAAASHPLISRTDSLVVLPGTLPAADLKQRLELTDAAAILKLGRHAGTVRAVLEELDLLSGAVLVVRASLPDQRVIPFADAILADIPYFATVLVHRRGAAVR